LIFCSGGGSLRHFKDGGFHYRFQQSHPDLGTVQLAHGGKFRKNAKLFHLDHDLDIDEVFCIDESMIELRFKTGNSKGTETF